MLSDFASRDGVSKDGKKIAKNLLQEVAFLNRCLEFLAPGGRMGIVLPEGILATSSLQNVREWILRWAKIKAIISLTQDTFFPYGAGVKTNVIFLEKRVKTLSLEELNDLDEDYDVYMSKIKDIGYDATGKLTVSDEIAHYPPQVKEAVDNFAFNFGR